MPIDPEIATGAGAIIGGAVVFAGRYLYTKVLVDQTPSKNNGNGKQQAFCTEHHHIAKEVTSLCDDMKVGFKEVRETQLQMAKDIAHISGFIKGDRG